MWAVIITLAIASLLLLFNGIMSLDIVAIVVSVLVAIVALYMFIYKEVKNVFDNHKKGERK